MQNRNKKEAEEKNQGVSCKTLVAFLTARRSSLYVNGKQITGYNTQPFIREASEEIGFVQCQQKSQQINLRFQRKQYELIEDGYRDLMALPGSGPHSASEAITQFSCVFKNPSISTQALPSGTKIDIQDPEGSCKQEEVSRSVWGVPGSYCKS